jgi:ATP-dependent Zn protease
MTTRLLRRALLPAALLLALSSASASAVKTPRATYSVLQQQIAAHEVATAAVNKKVHDVHVTLKDGKHEIVVYPPHQEPRLVAQLSAAGATVKVKKKKKKTVKAAGHHLRYIAAGILVAIVAIGGAVYVVGRRRQLEAGPAGTSPAAASSPPPPPPPPAPASPEPPAAPPEQPAA